MFDFRNNTLSLGLAALLLSSTRTLPSVRVYVFSDCKRTCRNRNSRPSLQWSLLTRGGPSRWFIPQNLELEVTCLFFLCSLPPSLREPPNLTHLGFFFLLRGGVECYFLSVMASAEARMTSCNPRSGVKNSQSDVFFFGRKASSLCRTLRVYRTHRAGPVGGLGKDSKKSRRCVSGEMTGKATQ